MRLQLVLLAGVVFCALLVVDGQQQARKAFIALQQARQQEHQIDEDWGRLQLEESTWAMHARVGKIATGTLQMELPDASQMHVLFWRGGSGVRP